MGDPHHISIPFFGLVGPLIAYLVFKDRSPLLKEVGDRGAELLDPLHDRPGRRLDPPVVVIGAILCRVSSPR